MSHILGVHAGRVRPRLQYMADALHGARAAALLLESTACPGPEGRKAMAGGVSPR